MPTQSRELWQNEDPRRPQTNEGKTLRVPDDWDLLPPGDAALTRRVKAEGPAWVVKQRRGRRVMSQGVWAPAERIARLRAQLEAERADPVLRARREKQLEAGRKRRAKRQAAYVGEFAAAVYAFLDFAPVHDPLAHKLALAIAAHATPVGSGTVARTQRISVERRAEAATIAWLRHQTTGYDDMKIPRVKGMRREVRRMLADRSRKLLAGYRRGESFGSRCALRQALERARREHDDEVEDLL